MEGSISFLLHECWMVCVRVFFFFSIAIGRVLTAISIWQAVKIWKFAFTLFFVFFLFVSWFCHQVKKQLFGLDNRGMGAEVAVKNELRRTILVRAWVAVE